MNRKPLAELIPLLAKSIGSTSAVATGLLAPVALGASGDLDPDFADHGRLGPIAELKGPARSLEALDDGGILLGGGYLESNCSWYYCWYDPEFEGSGFVNALMEDGGMDGSYHAAVISDVEVFDIARQADGKVIAAGRRIGRNRLLQNNLVVFRLDAEGPLDTGFGINGIFELDPVLYGFRNQANSVLVDPDGHIVIAGARDESLIVLRLDAAGALDASFGSGGILTGPAHDYEAGSRIARTTSGSYRVTTSDGSGCRVIGVDSEGAIDATFGTAGYAPVATAGGNAIACYSMLSQDDDRLLLTGITDGQAFATRLLANGASDPAFAGTDVAASMSEATAIAVADDGKILVGGTGVRGATIMRLQATGQLDTEFGNAGATTIDLPSENGSSPLVHELAVQPDGSVIASGGDYWPGLPRPFAVRLLGDGGGDSPGVLSIEQPSLESAEEGEVVVTVRRTGGSSGPVSIAYRTAQEDASATGGEDYQELEDRLNWGDGDVGDRTITVSILKDVGAAEEHEYFAISLSDVEGGAGIGTRNATITILPDGSPAGQFSIDDYPQVISEFGLVQAWVYRNHYFDGPVSVTVTPVTGTATAGTDFAADSVTVTWGDQDAEAKLVEFQIVDDKEQEDNESFSLQLSNPTGGAVVGQRAIQSITIAANDAPVTGGTRGGGGGGAAGFLSLLLLGLAELLRSMRRLRGGAE